MIYNAGTISLSGNTATGAGTNWTAPASQIRTGQTIIVLSNPVQLFQITAINSATSLTVTPAAVAALNGQKYGILVTDSLSVDGLAQSISQLINEYDENIGAWESFASTTANQNVTVTINGQSISIPALGKLVQKGADGAVPVAQGGTGAKDAGTARTNLELGSASTKNAGTSSGNLMPVGAFGLGGSIVSQPSWDTPTNETRFIEVPPNSGSPFGGTGGGGISISSGSAAYGAQLMMPLFGDRLSMRSWSPTIFSNGVEFLSTGNTTVDGNGFLKRASPVVKIFGTGAAETNEESEGVVVTRTGPGEYLIEGCTGLNSDAGWGGIDGGFEIPVDRNKHPRIWLDYSVNANGSITVKTFHRTHPQAPEFAKNSLEGVNDGDPIDIPADSFVSVRVEMPQNSPWNRKQADIQKRMQDEILKRQESEKK